MWWKIYFWIYAAITVLGMISLGEEIFMSIGSTGNLPVDVVGLYINTIPRVAIFAYVFKKPLFPKRVWKFLFWILIVLLIESFLEIYVLPKDFISKFIPFLHSNAPVRVFEFILPQVIGLPALYAVYRLGYKKK